MNDDSVRPRLEVLLANDITDVAARSPQCGDSRAGAADHGRYHGGTHLAGRNGTISVRQRVDCPPQYGGTASLF